MTPKQLHILADKHRGESITLYEAWQQELPSKHVYEAIQPREEVLAMQCDLCSSWGFYTLTDAKAEGWTFAPGAQFCERHF